MIKLIVSGRVGQDAELKTVGDTMVCSFSVAHTEKVYGPNPSEKTVWIGCNIWGDRAEKLKPYITKGTYVVVEGAGGLSVYTQKNGEVAGIINCRVSSLEFGGKPTSESAPVSSTPPSGKINNFGDEELPF